MRILTRYVLFEFLKVFLLTLTGLTLLIFIVLIGKEFVDKGLGLGPLLRMAPYLIPQAMQFAVPGTMLLATTSVYGRMASYNEIVAVKALGISPMALIWPTLILATLVSFIAVMINDVAVSWGTMGARRVFLSSFEEVTYSQLKMRHSYNMGKANITVRGVEGHRLLWPTLIVQSTGDKPAWTVSAKQAELQLVPDEGKLIAKFYDVELDGPVKYNDPDMFEYVMSIEDLTARRRKTAVRRPIRWRKSRRPFRNKNSRSSGPGRPMSPKLRSACSPAISSHCPTLPGSRLRRIPMPRELACTAFTRSLGVVGPTDLAAYALC